MSAPAATQIPEEVKNKKAKTVFCFKNEADAKVANEKLVRTITKKKTGEQKERRLKVFKIPAHNVPQTLFVLGGSQKDALGKAAMFHGVNAERLDAPAKKTITVDDIEASVGNMSPEDVKRLSDALAKVKAHTAKK